MAALAGRRALSVGGARVLAGYGDRDPYLWSERVLPGLVADAETRSR